MVGADLISLSTIVGGGGGGTGNAGCPADRESTGRLIARVGSSSCATVQNPHFAVNRHYLDGTSSHARTAEPSPRFSYGKVHIREAGNTIGRSAVTVEDPS
ncbi:hypothetical protein Acor_72550 [Acrocarpospora corrugata]|uniref:Uncharacterized protein n=1 Tax=Acrocarpospora corrugata TaxID=35763 RepID=A0A5M3W7Z2_9ACTN|nr:hypothetical protein Acor_72550 [Acrocarpospora corrugata]